MSNPLSRRALLCGLAALPLGCARSLGPSRSAAVPGELVDLSHPLGPGSPYIHVENATFPFRRTPIATIPERGVYANAWHLTEHIGTHVDAPCHFDSRARCLERIPVEDLFAEAVVIDLRARAQVNPDTELTLDDLDAWKARHGPLPSRCAILLCSGWDARWPSQERFANADERGVLHFPGFSHAAIEHLATRPEVLGIGVDTLSIDPGRDQRYEGHRVWSAADKWALECLAKLEQLPPAGAQLFVGAPKVELASGSPARVVAWVPRPTSRRSTGAE